MSHIKLVKDLSTSVEWEAVAVLKYILTPEGVNARAEAAKAHVESKDADAR